MCIHFSLANQKKKRKEEERKTKEKIRFFLNWTKTLLLIQSVFVVESPSKKFFNIELPIPFFKKNSDGRE